MIYKRTAEFHENRFHNIYRRFGMRYEPESADKLYALEINHASNSRKRPLEMTNADKSTMKKKRGSCNPPQPNGPVVPPKQNSRENPINLDDEENAEILISGHRDLTARKSQQAEPEIVTPRRQASRGSSEAIARDDDRTVSDLNVEEGGPSAAER